MNNQFNFMFMLFPTLLSAFFIVFVAILVTNLLRNLGEWHRNNHQPVLSVAAKVVAKRAHTSYHRHGNHSADATSYYVTFEVESGDRMELHMPGREFGLLAEGDEGKLTFQGTRFHGFERYRV